MSRQQVGLYGKRMSRIISPNKLLNSAFLFGRQVNGLKQVEFAFNKSQVCFSLDILQILRLVASKAYFLPACECPDGNLTFEKGVSENSGVIGNRAVRSVISLGLFVKFITVRILLDKKG
jgi:hypothetical protein